MLGHWVDHLIDQASDGQSIILIDWKYNRALQWVAGLDLGHSKLYIFIFLILYKKLRK